MSVYINLATKRGGEEERKRIARKKIILVCNVLYAIYVLYLNVIMVLSWKLNYTDFFCAVSRSILIKK